MAENEKVVTIDEMVEGFKKLGIKEGDILNLKISLKSIGKVERGADGVVESLLNVVGESGTLVTESFVNTYYFPRMAGSKAVTTEKTKSYAGAVANALIKRDDCFFSKHPIQRFAAIGARAEELMNNHTPDSEAYNVLEEMSRYGGKNLRVGGFDKVIGVGTTHVAITKLRLRQKRIKSGVLYQDNQGNLKKFMINWPGGCASGFNKMLQGYLPNLSKVQKGFIGNAECLVTDMEETLNYELQLFKEKPNSFFCENPYCVDCRISWKFSKEKWFPFFIKCLKNKNYKNAFKAVGLQVFYSWQPRK